MELKENKDSSVLYTVTVSNNTDDKLYNVPILNFSHKSQNKISYGCINERVTYEEFIAEMENNPIDSELMWVYCFGDYDKFVRRQVNQKLFIEYKETAKGGRIETMPVQLRSHPSDMQGHIVKLAAPFKLGKTDDGAIFNVFFEYLMPEVSMTLHIYPKSESSS